MPRDRHDKTAGTGERGVFTLLGLGGNMGDVAGAFRTAAEKLVSASFRMEKMSSIYRTAPVGCEPGAPDFLNAALSGWWNGTPLELLSVCKQIEVEAGRPEVHPKWHSRPLDIDIILFGNEIISDSNLVIPHPMASERAFVLVPLSEIAPDVIFPDSGKKTSELLSGLNKSELGSVRLCGDFSHKFSSFK